MDRFDHIFISPRNFEKSLSFYRDVLRWTVVTEWEEGGARGAILQSDGGLEIVLAQSHDPAEDHSWREGRNGHRPTIHVATSNIDSRFSQLPTGDHIIISPEKTHWGVEWFVVKDPDDNVIAFCSKQATEKG